MTGRFKGERAEQTAATPLFAPLFYQPGKVVIPNGVRNLSVIQNETQWNEVSSL